MAAVAGGVKEAGRASAAGTWGVEEGGGGGDWGAQRGSGGASWGSLRQGAGLARRMGGRGWEDFFFEGVGTVR